MLDIGANSGVGLAAVKVIAGASDAFHVIMTGRSLQKLDKAKEEVEAAGIKGSISTAQLDVIGEKSIQQVVEYVQEKFGRLDVLVNNAGVGTLDPDIKTRMRLCLDTNVIGPTMVASAFRPLLLKAPNPYSIFVSSSAGSITRAAAPQETGYRSLPNEEAYRASKAALNMVAVLEAVKYGAEGLKAFAVEPGFVVSNLRGTSEEARSGWGRAGDPMDSGRMILSVIDGERDADTGKLLHKDGVHPW